MSVAEGASHRMRSPSVPRLRLLLARVDERNHAVSRAFRLPIWARERVMWRQRRQAVARTERTVPLTRTSGQKIGVTTTMAKRPSSIAVAKQAPWIA
jgi:hypothetical protein